MIVAFHIKYVTSTVSNVLTTTYSIRPLKQLCKQNCLCKIKILHSNFQICIMCFLACLSWIIKKMIIISIFVITVNHDEYAYKTGKNLKLLQVQQRVISCKYDKYFMPWPIPEKNTDWKALQLTILGCNIHWKEWYCSWSSIFQLWNLKNKILISIIAIINHEESLW